MKRLTLFVILLPLALFGQQYTLDDLVNHGLEHSWSRQKSQLGYASSSSSLSSAKWNLLPEASLGLSVVNDFTEPQPPGKSHLSSSAGFTLSKTISLNDPSWITYKYAVLDEQRAKLALEGSAGDYAYGVFRAYLNVLSAQKQLASLQKNLEIQTRVWEQSKVMNQLGKNTSYDVKESEIAVMNSRIAIIQMENSIATKRRELFGLVQLEDAGYGLAELEPDPDFTVPAYSAQNSNQIKLLKADLKKSELGLKQSKLDFFPRIGLSYNLSRNVSGDDFDFNHYGTNHTLALNLSYSLWNQFRQKQTVRRSDLGLRLAELELEDKVEELGRQYEQLNQELSYLLRLDELYREKLDQSGAQIRIAEERFRLGLVELLELDKTRVNYIDSEIAYNSNRYQILAQQEAINNLLSLRIQGKW